jgi:hypothetical protein
MPKKLCCVRFLGEIRMVLLDKLQIRRLQLLFCEGVGQVEEVEVIDSIAEPIDVEERGSFVHRECFIKSIIKSNQ